MSSVQSGLAQAGDEAGKIKSELEGKVDDFIKGLEKGSWIVFTVETFHYRLLKYFCN